MNILTSCSIAVTPRPAKRLLSISAAFFASLAFPAEGLIAQESDSTKKKAKRMQELVVSASGFEQEKKDAPASVTVLNGAQLKQQRNGSLAEVLADVEGVDIGGTAGKTGGLNISIRGMPSDYTLVLIDGRRQNTAGSITPNGFGETSTGFLPPISAIDRIEVIRGPMATLYGSDAMGGVINIITKRVARRWTGSFTTDATVQERSGFGNTYGSNAEASGPLIQNLLGLSVRGSVFRREAADLEPTGEFGENTEISKRGPSPVRANIHTLGAKLSFLPGRGHVATIDFDAARQSYDNRNAELGTLDRPDADPPTYNGYGPKQHFNRRQVTLAHSWRFGKGVVESSFMNNFTETVGRTLPPGTPGGPPGSGVPPKPSGDPRTLESTSNVFDTKLTSTLGAHVFTTGGQIWGAKMIDGVALIPFKHTQWSLFVEDEWRFVPTLAMTVGVRRDDHNAFGGQTSPRVYFVWNSTPTLSLKAGISRGYKTPRVEQLQDGIIGFTGQGRTATIGSPNLKPETSTTTEMGAYYSNGLGLSANLSLFNNEFKDKITSGESIPNCTFAANPDRPGCVNYGSFPTQEYFGQSVNIDRAMTRGIEMGSRIPVLSFMSFMTNYTFTESKQKSGEDKGARLSNTPKHMVNASLRAQATENISAWLRGEYRSKRARSTSNSANAAYAALGDFKAYSLFHLGGSYQFIPGVTVNATIYNLLNTDFLKYASYQGTPTSSNPSGVVYTNLYNNHQEGRRLWLSTTIAF